MKVVQVLNNNVVLASDDDGQAVVLTGRGLGFNARKGDVVSPGQIRQKFVLADESEAQHVARTLADIPEGFIVLASDLLANRELPASTVVALADHLNLAVQRTRMDPYRASRPNPLAAEVAHLYPDELVTAREILQGANEQLARRGVPSLPQSEETAIALHLVNASFSSSDLRYTYQVTEIFSQIFDVIDAAYGRKIDRGSLSAARFITHMRYFFVRYEQGRQLDEGMSLIRDSLLVTHPEAVGCASRLAAVLELELGGPLTVDERSYLALHIVRLTG